MFFACMFLLVGQAATQSFNLYPTVNPDDLARALDISIDCLDALNSTLPCDQDLFQMTSTVDNYFWTSDNLTALCTRDCFAAANGWNSDVQNRCAGDTLVAYNKVVPADSVAGRYLDGIQIACLTNGNSTDDDVEPSWCLVESQDWVGSDVIRPDCSDDPSDPSCSDATNVSPANERLANLYGDDVLCSDCFIHMMYQRLVSPYLPNQDYSDYLVSQYQDILDVCDYANNIPELVIQAPPNYASAIPPRLNLSSSTDTACTGQTILKSTLDPNADCASIAQAFNVATGAVQAATANDNCVVSQSTICLPPPCTLKQVPAGATCSSLATAFSTSKLAVTTVQFLNWNPSVNGLCDDLIAGDYVCASAPGGVYVPPPPPLGSVNTFGQLRGGNVGSDVGAGTGLSPSGVGSNAPTPTQAGIVVGCTKYDQPQAGDSCGKFASDHDITPAQLYAWNGVFGLNGANCGSQLFLGYYYCIAGPTPAKTSSSPTSSETPAPSPTQPGIAPKCNKYAQVQSGDFCTLFAEKHKVSPADLYAWNIVLGTNGINCGTKLFLGYYYCIGVSS